MESATLRTAKDSAIPSSLGYCPDDAQFLRTLNKARQRLFGHGRWWKTLARMRFCVEQACITWPAIVANPERIVACGNRVETHPVWFDYLFPVQKITTCQTCSNSPQNGLCSSCGCLQAIDHLTSPTSHEFHGPKYVRLYPGATADYGKRVLIQGYDSNNIWIRTMDGGHMVDGVYVTLAAPFATSVTQFNSITGIQKDATTQRVLAYQVDPTTATETPLASWGASERNPSYRRTYLPFLSLQNCSVCQTTVDAIVKLACLPVEVDTDWLVIDNLVALEHACRGELWFEQGRSAEAREQIALAIAELNHELRTHTGDRTEVFVDVSGCATLNRQFAGFR